MCFWLPNTCAGDDTVELPGVAYSRSYSMRYLRLDTRLDNISQGFQESVLRWQGDSFRRLVGTGQEKQKQKTCGSTLWRVPALR